jgi:hypothetical protein
MTTAERNAIASPATGLTIFNTTENCLQWYVTDGWYDGCDNSIFSPGDVRSTTGKIWKDRNLGASQVATASNDFNAYGSLYQWGRLSDGHEIINWTSPSGSDGAEQSNETTTTTTSTSPPTSDFIKAGNWYIGTNPDDLWQGVSGINNPCPTGYRLPTEAELDAERLSWGTNDAAGAFNSPLKLPTAGNRSYSSGNLLSQGSGNYWSSTVSGGFSRLLEFTSGNASMQQDFRGDGYSVRCLKE